MSKIIGIGLGTTNSVVTVLEGSEAKIITSPEGNRIAPSIVSFGNGEIQVGEVVKCQAVTDPNTISSIKRYIGEAGYKVDVRGKPYTPQEISAMVFQYIKGLVEDYLGERVEKAVITVPAYFSDAQHQAIKDAGKTAGLEVERIVSESTTAALAYGLDKADHDEKILIFDLGGGTFDVPILELGGGVFDALPATDDNHLGGGDFDSKVIDYMVAELRRENSIDLSQDKMALQRLKDATEKAKKNLSDVPNTQISLPFIIVGESEPLHLEMALACAKFDESTTGSVERTKVPVRQALEDAGLSQSEIDEVVLVGGSTRILVAVETVRRETGREPNKSVNPDEVVAMGTAVQDGAVTGDVRDVILLDVTLLLLDIETMGGVFTRLIDRNTTIPTSKLQVFSTAAGNQPAVDIHVLQGGRPIAADNKALGRFQLTDIPTAPHGVPQTEITFDISKDGIANVPVKNLGTQKEQRTVIRSSSGLAGEETEHMVKDVETNAEADRVCKEEVDLRNDVDVLLFSADKTLKGLEGKVDEEEVKKAETARDELRAAVEANSIKKMKTKYDALNETVRNLIVKLYEQAARQRAQENLEAAQSGVDNVVDVDPEEVDDDNK